MSTLTPDFERRLIENIQPIRYFFLAEALHHALDLGVFAAIGDKPGLGAEALAGELGLDAERLRGLLLFLQNEGYLVDDGGWSLTGKGAGLPAFAPWYEMLVGGYTPTMQQLSDVLRPGAPWATRNTTKVGAGSCGIGMYDALPLVQCLIDAADLSPSTVVDLGCGNADFLIELLLSRPGLHGIGVEPNPGSIEAGKKLRTARGVEDRLELFTGTAADVVKLELPDQGRGACFMTAFVLQEMLQQDGEQAVEDMLRNTFDSYPNARWLVVEMDYQPTSPIMAHGLALAFYNPYFLIHTITEQRLHTRQWWIDVFDRLGLTRVAAANPDSRADSTGLQFGFLLSKKTMHQD
jgi:2-ketoarginine methyltransferase